MSKILLSVFLMLLCSSQTSGHMWLRTPLSRGGLNNIGGTGSPCNNLVAGSGTRTTYEVGQQVTFQFRVNQHGPGPFKFALATSGNDFSITLKDNIPNTVTAGPDSFNGVNVEVTIPNQVCSSCSIQLSGMAKADGTGAWYQCADIEIVAAGQGGVPLITNISPNSADTAGGQVITVTGSRFGSSQAGQKCRFGATVVSATWVSDSQLTCVTPVFNFATETTLEVSRDGTSFSSSGSVFTYTGNSVAPSITSISPTKGGIGTVIFVDGANFLSTSVTCVFGTMSVSAHWVSSERVTCNVPDLPEEVTTTPVEVSIDGSPPSASGFEFVISTRSAASNLAPSFPFLALLLSLTFIPLLFAF